MKTMRGFPGAPSLLDGPETLSRGRDLRVIKVTVPVKKCSRLPRPAATGGRCDFRWGRFPRGTGKQCFIQQRT